ncbi:SPOR domain-containing protein [Xinfangfangia sp. CPCC 101601]|uniref:SPOR domain-containing protein n=1 Tax=Pseudogemmobacter lacusdianii TaxID=3069608 RepID=A0ABU0VUU8_9RHOB|nr:SPOR domain-containing protein [Xinfangfangia sp. CPCC 101601]MDQ2065516.1 SPOR domain-containing protein [Xinfangfangia sp. CPCC 101601]
MADRDYADYGAPAGPPRPGKAQRLVQIAGAVSSIALVVGLGVWGYRLAVRDISGVPVIRALEGPARIAPEDPGGAVADHQGLAVNDVVAEGIATPPADRLVLAPKPVELSSDDGPGLGSLTPEVVPPEVAEAAPQLSESPAALVPTEVDPEVDAVALALAEALGIAPDEIDTGVESAALDDAGAPAPPGAITRSPRPMPRPNRSGGAELAVEVAPPTEVAPETLEVGTRLVQFGTFNSESEARSEWTRLAGRFGALMAGKSMVIQSAVSGGSTFYRLRALGFEGEDDARRFCSALLIENASCIPVSHK